MRAYGFVEVGGPERQAFLDVPVPVPGLGQLLVRVRAAGVNPGDWRLRDGAYGIAGPAVLGREVAGTVLASGPDVTGFAAGDEVFGGCPGMVGGWAEQALVDASFAAHHPEEVSPETACVLPVAAGTALDALGNLALPEGATLGERWNHAGAAGRAVRARPRERAARAANPSERAAGPQAGQAAVECRSLATVLATKCCTPMPVGFQNLVVDAELGFRLRVHTR